MPGVPSSTVGVLLPVSNGRNFDRYRPIYLRIDRYGRYQAYRPVEGGPRTGILSDRYVPPVPGGTARNCIP
ncbi:unnamed protein product [Musa textilis]